MVQKLINRRWFDQTNWDQPKTNTTQIQIPDELESNKYKHQPNWDQRNTNTRQIWIRQIQAPEKYKHQTNWYQTNTNTRQIGTRQVASLSLCRSASIVPLSLLLPFLQHLLSPEDRMARLVWLKFNLFQTKIYLTFILKHWMPPATDWKLSGTCFFLIWKVENQTNPFYLNFLSATWRTTWQWNTNKFQQIWFWEVFK